MEQGEEIDYNNLISSESNENSNLSNTNNDSCDVEKTAFNICLNLVNLKKLQFNFIWSNKITQENLNTPKLFEDVKQNIILNEIILNSIIKFAEKINTLFKEILYSESNEIDKLTLWTSALIQKMKNLLAVKNKNFSIKKESLKPLIELKQFYQLFQDELIQNELSKKLDDFYQYINEFNNIISSD